MVGVRWIRRLELLCTSRLGKTVRCRCKTFLLHGPDFELEIPSASILEKEYLYIEEGGLRTSESHDPVHKLMPSLLTPRQLTRLSWPTSEPTFSPLVISQT
jgi:hypothetical protein